jgi:hypothetical protein
VHNALRCLGAALGVAVAATQASAAAPIAHGASPAEEAPAPPESAPAESMPASAPARPAPEEHGGPGSGTVPAASAASRPSAPAAYGGRLPSWEALPAYRTAVHDTARLHEEEPIGEYGQPRWTARRRFPTTRLYVVPAGKLEFEWWYELKLDLGGTSPPRTRTQWEFEMGLGHRLQLDLYLTTQQEGWSGPLFLHEEKVELRWAIANWGVIPGNPTLYLEWVHANDGPMKLEAKLLFGGAFAPRLHWGANLVWEHELGAPFENEYAATVGIAYTLKDGALSLGVEALLELTRPDALPAIEGVEVLGGPSLAWHPVPAMNVLLVALFGAESTRVAPGLHDTAPIFEPTLIVGWEI